MGKSLKLKISLLFTFLLFLMIFLCWMANNFFLPAYYEKTKVNSLEDVFDYYEKERDSADNTTKISRLKQIAASCGERMVDGYDPVQVDNLARKSGIQYCHDLSPKDIDDAFFSTSTGLSAFEGVHLMYCGL